MYFLDIDHREMSDPLLQKLLNRHNSYTEYSPSGNGIHILGTCDSGKLPIVYDEKKKRDVISREYYQKNPNNEVELYIGSITNRFATFTGNVINDLPLTEGTVAVLTTLQEDMKRPEKGKKSTAEDSERMLFDVVTALRKQKNVEKFIKLYDKGDISDYGSQSEAYAALCAMGHSDISVTMNVYTHISFDDAEEELKRMEEFRKAQVEIEKKNDAKMVSQKMFKVV